MQPAAIVAENVERLRKLKERAEHLASDTPKIVLLSQRDPLKRIFDIVFSCLFLTFFFPVFLTLIFLVRFTSKGPVFFKSRRLGQKGKIIECLKFRTMYEDAEERLHHLLDTDSLFRAEWETFQKVKSDPRITPIGRFLRKTSLDEIPQFWNVLRGDLSVVGPRPPTLLGPPENFLQEISLLYGARTAKILSVKPGITGLWQISGRSQISFEDRCKLEAHYVENRTFWLDLAVILKTVPAVLFSRGAF